MPNWTDDNGRSHFGETAGTFLAVPVAQVEYLADHHESPVVQSIAREALAYRALKIKVEAVLALCDPDAEYDIADIQEMLS